MRYALTAIALCLATSICSWTAAQSLPKPGRTVFKCEADGKVVYSDEPCLGAQRVDVQPTRGLDKSTGTERVGTDVRREQHDEAMAKALKPLLNETPEQYALRHRRAGLDPAAQARCRRLDKLVPMAEWREKRAAAGDRGAEQAQLLALRREQRDLRC